LHVFSLAQAEKTYFYNMNKFIGIALLGAGAWFFLRKGSTAKNTSWRFGGFSADWKKKVLNVTLIAGNPTGASLTVQALTGDVYLSGKPIASISNFESQTIQPNAESPIKLRLRPNLLGLGATVKALVSQGADALRGKLRFIGAARVQGITLPIDTTF